MGRNTTGPASRAAPWWVTLRRRWVLQTTTTDASDHYQFGPYTVGRRASNNRFAYSKSTFEGHIVLPLILQVSEVICQKTASPFRGRERIRLFARYVIMGWHMSHQNYPFPLGDLNPHLIRGSLDPHESALKAASWSVQPFLCAPQQRLHAFQWDGQPL